MQIRDAFYESAGDHEANAILPLETVTDLCFYADDPPWNVRKAFWVALSHRHVPVLLDQLFSGIQDDVQGLGHWDLDIGGTKPPREHRQLLRPPLCVA